MGDYKPTILGLGIAFPLLAIIAVGLRFQARLVKGWKIYADDVLIVLALIGSIGFSIDVIIDSRLGNLGGHTVLDDEGYPVGDPNSFIIFGKTNWIAQLLWVPTLGFTKLSFLFFFKRIFRGPVFVNSVTICIWLVIGWSFAMFMALLLSCLPISSQWGAALEGKCVDMQALYLAIGITDILADVAILSLPVYNVTKLQMRTRKKIAVIGTFLLGGLVTISAIVRLAFIAEALPAITSATADITYIFAPMIFWSMIETNLGVVSACLPLLRPLAEVYKIDKISSTLKRVISRTWTGSAATNSSAPDPSKAPFVTHAEYKTYSVHVEDGLPSDDSDVPSSGRRES